jgi:protein ImuB
MRTYVRMTKRVVTVLIPRFELKVAAGGNEPLLGNPLALAPADAGERLIGQTSAAAGAFGVAEGMTVSEALSRCPQLVLVPPDPVGSAESWEEVLVALEAIGAHVAAPRTGVAQFESDGLLNLHGGIERVVRKARGCVDGPARVGVAPGPFASRQAAESARPRRAKVISGGEEGTKRFLAGLPVDALETVPGLGHLPSLLERFGLLTLGSFAKLPRNSVADRFGSSGIAAHELALGRESRLRPRRPVPPLTERIALPEASGGQQLQHALDLLVRRLLARREREGRALRSVALSAALDGGGTWRKEVCFREALDDPDRILIALTPLLGGVTGPPRSLGMTVVRFGPVAADQTSLVDEPHSVKLGRLREAVRQARAAAGPDAALRVVAVEPESRLPERRMALSPFEV